MSVDNEYYVVKWANPFDLKVSKYNMRKKQNDESDDMLLQSISQVGVTYPLLVQKGEVVDGSRRLRVCQRLVEEYERTDIKVPYINIKDDDDPALISLIVGTHGLKPIQSDFDDQVYYLISSGMTYDQLHRTTGIPLAMLHDMFDTAQRKKKPLKAPEGLSEEEVRVYTSTKQKLSKEKQKSIERLVDQMSGTKPQVKVKLVKWMAETGTRDKAKETAKQLKQGLAKPEDAIRLMEYDEKNVRTKWLGFSFPEDVVARAKKRITREVSASLPSLVIDLVRKWADYELYDEDHNRL